MSQENKDKADAAEARTQQTKGFMQQVRVAARRKYTPEEKVRIVLEGFRREVAVNELCRREGIKPGAYYAWTKDFMEAGKERLTRMPSGMPPARKSTGSSERIPTSSSWWMTFRSIKKY